LKGAIQLDKKSFTSWGVSFGSLALVAGMVSYLGLTAKDTTAKSNQSQAANQNSTQQVPLQNGDSQNSFGSSANDNQSSSTFRDDQPTTDNGASFNFGDDSSSDNNGQSFFDDDSSQQNNNQTSDRGSFGHRGQFDTTTGGT
jgi:hypothetical protein